MSRAVRSLRRRFRRRRPKSVRRFFRPRVEMLEDRILLANAPPVNIVPNTLQTALLEQPFAFTEDLGNGIQVTDPDGTDIEMLVTLRAVRGTMTMVTRDAVGNDITFLKGDGLNDAEITVRGPQSRINDALSWLVFDPARGYTGSSAGILIMSNDLGNIGGGALTDSDAVSIRVVSSNLSFNATPSWTTIPGELETSFSGNGKEILALTGGLDYIDQMEVLPGGSIIGVGVMGDEVGAIRFEPELAIDGSFGSGGLIKTGILDKTHPGSSLEIDRQGRLLIGGNQVLVRYSAEDGKIDSSFGSGGGISLSGSSRIHDIDLQPDGQILLTSETGVYRVAADGGQLSLIVPGDFSGVSAIDNSNFLAVKKTGEIQLFNSVGEVVGNAKPTVREGNVTSILELPDNRILVVGVTGTVASDFFVRRYFPDGSDDASFGNGGETNLSLVSGDDVGYRAALQADGKIIVAGFSASGGNSNDFGVARLLFDGVPDSSFGSGTSPSVVISVGSGTTDQAYAVAVRPDGRIVVAGDSSGDIGIVQLHGDWNPPTIRAISDVNTIEDFGAGVILLNDVTAGAGDGQDVQVTTSSDNPSLFDSITTTFSNSNLTGNLNFDSALDKSGVANVTVRVEDGGLDGELGTPDDNSFVDTTFKVTVASVNDAPTINSLGNLTLSEDADTRTVNLSGITAGGGESQVLQVTASSDNTSLIPNPTVTYTSAASSGSISFTPEPNQSGTASITVVVEDAGPDGDLDDARDNASTSVTFVVTVNAVNDVPTISAIDDITIDEDASQQTLDLIGITAGGGENQSLAVTAVSSNATLIPNPTVSYESAASSGSLRLTPNPDAFGTVTITVTVTDAGLDGDLTETADNGETVEVFTVRVNAVNDQPTLSTISPLTVNEDAAQQSVSLVGISAGGGESQPLRVAALSNKTSLIPNPTVSYTSANSTGTLFYTPVSNASGSALILVRVEDGGLDGNLSTSNDNAFRNRIFSVTVNPVNDDPTITAISTRTVSEDAESQTVSLSGITAGGGESQPLSVGVTSGDSDLILINSVSYESASSTGSFVYTPVADASGSTSITVLVTDGGLDGNLSTANGNGTTSTTFTVTVGAVNDDPTIDTLTNVSMDEDDDTRIINLSGITAGGGESQPLKVTAASDNTSLIPNPSVSYTSANSTGSISFAPVADQSGTATITVTVEDGGLDGDLNSGGDNKSTVETFTVTVNAVNDVPTVNSLVNLSIDEDSSEDVQLAGISAGGGESQALAVKASSDNIGLVPNPPVTYASANSTGSIKLTPVADASGSALITVTVEDAGLDGKLATTNDNETTTRTFTVTVSPLNDEPTIDTLANLFMDEDDDTRTVNLSGITAGGSESQPLRVTAASNNISVVPNPSVSYSSADSIGSIQFKPLADQSGVATITVTVTDGGLDNNLATANDNASTVRTFNVTVDPVNDVPTVTAINNLTISEDATEQSVPFTGVSAGGGESQPLQVTTTSSNTSLIPNPSVSYTTPETTGSFKFTPFADASGSTLITVTVTDGGLDGNLATNNDNASTVRSFTVTVDAVNDVPTVDTMASLSVAEDAIQQTVSIAGVSAGGGENQPIQITASSDNTNLVPNPSVSYVSGNSGGSLKYQPLADQSGAATITVTVTDGGLDGNLATNSDNASTVRTFDVTVSAVNDLPTLGAIDDSTISEDAAEQSVPFAGVSAGGGENQPLQVTAISGDTNIIPHPTVTYTSAASIGSLAYTPLADQSGTVKIFVTVTDGGLDGDLETAFDNSSRTNTFDIVVDPVNDDPTVDTLANLSVAEDAIQQTVSIAGVSAGGGENQPIQITASSDNTNLVLNPSVTYVSGNSAGSLKYQPLADQSGTATITVTVTDGGLDGDLSSSNDNVSTVKTFSVTVNPVNDSPVFASLATVSIDEDAPQQSQPVSGIAAGGGESQPLQVTAVSSNTGLVGSVAVDYTSPSSNATLSYQPIAEESGNTVITVTVTDGGLDGDLLTAADNESTAKQFTVRVGAVSDPPVIDLVTDRQVDEDSVTTIVDLTGIAAGGNESQPIRVTAGSNNVGLIPDPVVTYASAETTGSLAFTPVADASGSALITVTVEDGGADADLDTASDNDFISSTFKITVDPVNDDPLLDSMAGFTVDEDALVQTVNLEGIAAGGGEGQPLAVSAISDNTGLIPNPAVSYTSANSSGSISFTPLADQSGSATISVTITDGGLDGDLSTAGDNGTSEQIFTVTVDPVNDDPLLDAIFSVTVDEDASLQTVNLEGIAAGGGESQPLEITASSSNTGLIPNPAVSYNSASSSGSISFTPLSDQSGSAVVTVTITDGGLDGDLSTAGDNGTSEQTFTVTVDPVNDEPLLDAIVSVTVDEDASVQTVNLEGIAAGGGESQPLEITASSSNTGLIPNPAVSYSSASSSGSISFTPLADQSGSAVVTVTITDGGLDGDLSTAGDNGTSEQTFTVTVDPVNDDPLLDAIVSLTVDEDASVQTVNLEGIAAGGGESQPLAVTAASDNLSLIANPAVTYTSPDSTGAIQFTPLADQSGSAVVTVTVTDGGLDGDLSTAGDNGTTQQTFTVTVNAVNDAPLLDAIAGVTVDEDASLQTVNLQGIAAGGGESQPLEITASSSNTGLIPNPAVSYSSASSSGSISFTPLADQSGSAVVTVTVTDGGLDGDLSTAGDNGTSEQTFTVTVNAVNDAPLLNAIAGVTVDEDASVQTVNLAGIAAGGGESQVLRIAASSDNSNLIPIPDVSYTSPSSSGSISFAPLADQSGSATVTVLVEDGGLDDNLATAADNRSTEQTFMVTVGPVNDLPTITALSDLTINEDASTQTVDLEGITAGGGESQPLLVTVVSSNTGLIPNPTVSYASADSSGSISFTPMADQSGSATITITVTDGGLDGDLTTTSDNATISDEFVVTVNAVNDIPTLAALGSVTINEDAPTLNIDLAGISTGGGESQPLQVTAASSNRALIANPTVSYTSAESSGSISLLPLADQSGSAVVTITVTDGGLDGDLATTDDNASSSQNFTVTVDPVNDLPTITDLADQQLDEDALSQSLNLAGILAGGGENQPLEVTATSSNKSLAANPTVSYSSAQSSGAISFVPLVNQHGTTVITVSVEDGGLDGDLATESDNLVTSTNFTLTVNSVNDAPTVTDGFYQLNENQQVSVDVASGLATLADDVDQDAVTFSLLKGPEFGELEFNQDGSFSYTPNANYNRTDRFTFLASDGELSSGEGVVELEVQTEFPWHNGASYAAGVTYGDDQEQLSRSVPRGFDVDDDRHFTARDILTVINTLNEQGPHELSATRDRPYQAPFLDVNRDGSVTSLDVILVQSEFAKVVLPPIVRIRVVPTDESGAVITEIGEGQAFWLRTYVLDVRGGGGGGGGVFAAYFDIEYTTGMVEAAADENGDLRDPVFPTIYTEANQGEFLTGQGPDDRSETEPFFNASFDVINELGGSANTLRIGRSEFEFSTIEMKAGEIDTPQDEDAFRDVLFALNDSDDEFPIASFNQALSLGLKPEDISFVPDGRTNFGTATLRILNTNGSAESEPEGESAGLVSLPELLAPLLSSRVEMSKLEVAEVDPQLVQYANLVDDTMRQLNDDPAALVRRDRQADRSAGQGNESLDEWLSEALAELGLDAAD